MLRVLLGMSEKTMSSPDNIQSTPQTVYRPQSCNQQRLNQQPLQDEKIKQMIMDTLIELNLVSQPQKKKVLADV
jgi:hypothetical protein